MTGGFLTGPAGPCLAGWERAVRASVGGRVDRRRFRTLRRAVAWARAVVVRTARPARRAPRRRRVASTSARGGRDPGDPEPAGDAHPHGGL